MTQAITVDFPGRFLLTKARREESELRYFERMPSLDKAIRCAVMGSMPYGTHDHNTGYAQLSECWSLKGRNRAIAMLIPEQEALRKCDSFHSLWLSVIRILCCRDEPHLPEATAHKSVIVYDIALWIGAYLGHRPRLVYLHAGAFKGAKLLLPFLKLKEGTQITLEMLPESWQVLDANMAETALCAFYQERRSKKVHT